jgi:hypothetical protein
VFDLVARVIENSCSYYPLQDIASLRAQMARQGEYRPLLKHESIHAKDGELLFRIANRYKPVKMIVLGDITGLASLYASGYASKLTVFSLCPDFACAENIRRAHHQVGRNDIEIISGEYTKGLSKLFATLPYTDFVFFNLMEEQSKTGLLFNQCLAHKHDQSVFVINGIKKSLDAYNEWKKITAHPDVSVAIELCRMGILLFNKKLHKHTYTLL